MAQGGWEGAVSGALAGSSIAPGIGTLIGGVLGFFTNIFGGGQQQQQESPESKRLRELITGYVQQGLQAQGYTPQQTATLMERVAQEQMGAQRQVGQQVSQYMAGRGLLDSGAGIAAQANAQQAISTWGAGQRAGITQASIDEQSRRRSAALSGAMGLLGLMSEQDRARWLSEQQGQGLLASLVSSGASAAFGSQGSGDLEAFLQHLTNQGRVPTGTGGLAPMTPTPSGSGLTGGYTATPVVSPTQDNYGLGVGGNYSVGGRGVAVRAPLSNYAPPMAGGQGFMGVASSPGRRSSLYSQSYAPQRRRAQGW